MPRHERVPAGAYADARRATRHLRDEHDRFLSAETVGGPGPAVRPVVAASWLRSRLSGVDPETSGPPLAMGTQELLAYRDAHPLARVMPLLRSLLVDVAEEAGHLVAVGDAHGRLLWVEGHAGLRSRAEGMQFVEGALWSEQAAGTNAPGTALALGVPVSILTAEHYGVVVQPWSCAAAPVRDPRTGAVIGVLDLTGEPDVAGPRALALVRAAAAAAGSELALLTRPDAAARPARRRPSAGSAESPARLQALGRDSALLEIGGRALTLSPRHSEIVLLLAAHPRGLTADQLDVALREDSSPGATVRAEVFRLRRVLGEDVLASRPYRLTAPVGTDVDQVHGLLACGSVLRALDAYEGPLLPRSDAPYVRQAREELVANVREAVLASHNARAIERWAATEAGHSDPAVWQALAVSASYGSPRQAAARAGMRGLGVPPPGADGAARRATSMQPLPG